jgi:hypothetical protein
VNELQFVGTRHSSRDPAHLDPEPLYDAYTICEDDMPAYSPAIPVEVAELVKLVKTPPETVPQDPLASSQYPADILR